MTATPEEIREATRGLLLSTTRLLTLVVLKVRAGEALTDEDADQARNLLRAVVELEQGRPRNTVNRELRTAPGEFVETNPHMGGGMHTTTIKPPANATINPSAVPSVVLPYDAGKAPDVMALAAKLREEKNRDRRLPVEKDGE